MDDKIWRENAGVKAREFARKNFGVDRMVVEMLDIYGYTKNDTGRSDDPVANIQAEADQLSK